MSDGDPIVLPPGEPVTVRPNRPVKANIAFVNGSTIQCVIVPNAEFTICNHGDVVSFDLTIDDESVRPIGLVTEEEG